MTKGLDANQDMTEWAGQLVQDGFGFVGRYINSTKAHPLTKPEVIHLSSKGLYIVSLYENGNPTSIDYFTEDQAHRDGQGAASDALRVGQPAGYPVYMPTDYDCTQDQFAQLLRYYTIVRECLKGDGYTAGCYGNGILCEYLANLGYVSHTWLAQSHGFTGYQEWLTRADIVQGPETTWHGIDVDLDTSNGDAGGWQIVS